MSDRDDDALQTSSRTNHIAFEGKGAGSESKNNNTKLSYIACVKLGRAFIVCVFGLRGKTKSLLVQPRRYTYTTQIPPELKIPECSAGILAHQL